MERDLEQILSHFLFAFSFGRKKEMSKKFSYGRFSFDTLVVARIVNQAGHFAMRHKLDTRLQPEYSMANLMQFPCPVDLLACS
jgi:hypothetical protein